MQDIIFFIGQWQSFIYGMKDISSDKNMSGEVVACLAVLCLSLPRFEAIDSIQNVVVKGMTDFMGVKPQGSPWW